MRDCADRAAARFHSPCYYHLSFLADILKADARERVKTPDDADVICSMREFILSIPSVLFFATGALRRAWPIDARTNGDSDVNIYDMQQR